MRNREKRKPSGREGRLLSGREDKFRPAPSAGIDYFRIAAAFLVIAIHTAPFSIWNKNGILCPCALREERISQKTFIL